MLQGDRPFLSAPHCLALVADILFGIMLIFPRLASLVTLVTHPLFTGFRAWFDRVFPPRIVDLGSGSMDYRVPDRYAIVYYMKNLLAPALTFFCLQVLFAGLFLFTEDHWSYGVSFYHCMVVCSMPRHTHPHLPFVRPACVASQRAVASIPVGRGAS